MQIKEINISKIKLYKHNNKVHNKAQIDLLKKTIQEFGYTNPVLLSDKNECIGGHGRIQAMQELGKETIPAVYINDLTPEQVRKLRLLDNKIAELAEDNLEAIKFELEELEDPELNELYDLNIETLDPDKEAIEDDVPEVPTNIIVEKGDIFQLGEHRLMCGDSTSIDDVEKLMDGEKADMVFTDPPYGVDFQSNMRTKSEKFEVLKNDNVFLEDWIPMVDRFSKGFVFVWTSWKVVEKWIEICSPIGKLSNMIIWFKGGGGIGDLKKTFLSDYEIALVYHRGAELTGKRLGSVWQVGKDGAAEYEHPTQKPIELMEKGLCNCSNKGDKILDLFGGSGSTLIASEKTNRKCYMMELDPKYVSVIIRRFYEYTGGAKNIQCLNRNIDIDEICKSK